MIVTRSRTVFLITFFLLLPLVVSCPAPPGSKGPEAPTEPNPAVSQPDRVNWEIFVKINRPVDQVGQVAGARGDVTVSHVFWETWASDGETFPAHPNPQDPPQWPGDGFRTKRLVPSTQLGTLGIHQDITWYTLQDGKPVGQTVSEIEEVRRNRATFDYIVDNDLWYVEGLEAAYQKAAAAVKSAKGDPTALAKAAQIIVFPVPSIEIKANWIPVNLIPQEDRGDYYTNYAATGDDEQVSEYALVAMHVISKQLPNWTWATFEHASLLGRCDYIGCRDDFGVDPAYVSPHAEPNYPYPPGTLTPELIALMKSANLDPVWQNYRLKGSQTDFTDSTGFPNLVGNTITEQGFVQTASCMSCHARSAVNGSGHFLSVFDGSATPPPPDTVVSFNGSPDSAWYWDTTNDQAYFYSGVEVKKLTHVQLDFVWGFLNASSASGD